MVNKYLYIYLRNVRPPCLDPGIPGSLDPEPNELPDHAHGRAIPHWNRLGKKI